MARAAVGASASWRPWLLPRRTPRGPLLCAPPAAMRVWCRVHRLEGEGAAARADGDQTTGGLSAGRRACGGSLRRAGRSWSHPREVRAASCGDGVCGVLGGAPVVCGRHLRLVRVLAEGVVGGGCQQELCALAMRAYFIVVPEPVACIDTGKQEPSNAPSWDCCVADAGLTASTSARNSRRITGATQL
ncbi:hypothetical protein TcYC6_0033560 [Trypanosoma cruzi]|nr:hypothetical protein TcYC6_0033560 [Trypanosoma cruzi]